MRRHILLGLVILGTGMLLLLPLTGHGYPAEGGGGGKTVAKIGGVSVVSPASKVDAGWCDPVRQINAEWVAILPYGFSRSGAPQVRYNLDRQWWGERFEGMTEIIRHAKQKGLKVMLKPMVWIPGSWPGGFELDSEEKWKQWETSYRKFIMELAGIAGKEGVDMFCVGTEFKAATQQRPFFWRKLIGEVREVFEGPVTYAANWDEYLRVPFWDKVDYIGIDAYFPLSPRKTASVLELKKGWESPIKQIEQVHKLFRKPILFTEFGYRSTDACTWNQWEIQDIPTSKLVNLQGQVNAYQAFFESVWDLDWFAGVFLWQWYTNNAAAGGEANSDYTPQNKPAEALIKNWFAKE